MLVTVVKLKPPILEVLVVATFVASLDLKTFDKESEGLKLKPPGTDDVASVDCFVPAPFVLAALNANNVAPVVACVVFTSVLALVTPVVSFPNTKPLAFNGLSLLTAVLLAPNLKPTALLVFVSDEAPNVKPLEESLDFFSESVFSGSLALFPKLNPASLFFSLATALLPNVNPEVGLLSLADPLLPNLKPNPVLLASDVVALEPNLKPGFELPLLLDEPASNLNPPVPSLAFGLESSLDLLFTLKPESGGLVFEDENEKPPVFDTLILPLEDELVDTGMLNPLDCDIVKVFAQLGTETEQVLIKLLLSNKIKHGNSRRGYIFIW